MKSLKSIALIIMVVILTGCTKTNITENNKTHIGTSDNTNIIEEVYQRRTLNEISGDYTLDEAEKDNAVIIKKDNLAENEIALNSFGEDLSANKNSTLRVVMETGDSLLYIVDVEISGDNFIVTENDVQLSGDVSENIYTREEYSFTDGVTTLEDGTLLKVYSLTTENFEKSIDLFAYIIEPMSVSGDKNEIIKSGE